jgi:hypothetical protein
MIVVGGDACQRGRWVGRAGQRDEPITQCGHGVRKGAISGFLECRPGLYIWSHEAPLLGVHLEYCWKMFFSNHDLKYGLVSIFWELLASPTIP